MAGIRELIYIAGTNVSRPPSTFSDKPGHARTFQRLRNGTLVRYSASPTTGDPDEYTKRAFEVGWEDLAAEADCVTLERASAIVGAFDFCPWRPRSERWTFAAGDSYSGNLLRRLGLTAITALLLPTNAASKYATVSYLNGSVITVTMGSVTNYRQAWTYAGTASAGDLIEIVYYPCYRVENVEEAVNYNKSLVEGWLLRPEEV